jgi:hypothetical protein
MKNEIKPRSNESSDEAETRSDVSRRNFLATSTGAIAAASVLGAGATLVSSEASAAVAPPEPESPDTSVRWKAERGGLYNEQRGYGDEDVVTGWPGRMIYGPTVGIVQLPANIPMMPGDVGNPTTFNFPVLYESIQEIDPFWILADKPHPLVMKKIIAACKRLTMQGVTTIIGNCGFFANYQPEVAASLDPGVQFFNGSLMQLPMLVTSVGANNKVGVLTASKKLLMPSPALKNSGVSDEDMKRIVVYGNEDGEEMHRVTHEAGSYSPKKLEKELVDLAKKMVEENPDVSAILLECTEFPPHASAIQNAVRLNVWDFVTMTEFMHAGAMRKPFTGWML